MNVNDCNSKFKASGMAVLVVAIMFCLSCTVVMNRKFEGEQKFISLDEDWHVGVPIASALFNERDKSLWDVVFDYQLYIPVRLKRTKDTYKEFAAIDEAVDDRKFSIDSVSIKTFPDESVVSLSLCDSSDSYAYSKNCLSYYQGYAGSGYKMFLTRLFTIPPYTDSILVSFSVELERSSGGKKEYPLQFMLKNASGKKLMTTMMR